MPSRAKKLDRAAARLPSIPKELIAQFLTGPMTGEAINAAEIAFKQALIEASLNAELTHRLGYAPGADRPELTTNQRNGVTAKTVLTGDGKMRIETPRDRDGSFEPLLLPKHVRRFTAFDDSIVALYARGLTVREIQGYLAESYGTEVSPDLISTVTDSVLAEVTAWQARPLETVYPVVFFDALRVKVRDDNVVRNKAVYLALGVCRDGSREILGLWIETTEGAKFWMNVFNDLNTRGVNDILIAVTDGLTGMPAALDAFEDGEWGRKFPTVVAAWRRAWDRVIPFFAFPPEIRRVIYTTNAIESVNARVRKIIKTRGHFPTDDAANKLIWLALRNITADWGKAAHNWKEAMNQFAILYDGRFNAAG